MEGMNAIAQQTEFLSWKIAPARLNATQTAWFLGFEPHDIPILVAAGLLKPLGHPARNAVKFFATQALEQLRQDEKWLARASDAICEYWRERNARNRRVANVGRTETVGSTGGLAEMAGPILRRMRRQRDDTPSVAWRP
jgi:hypothetical protein